MTDTTAWRPISTDETNVVRAVVSAAGVSEGHILLEELDSALVSHSTAWVLDVKVSDSAARADLPDGPFPARAYVPSKAAYRGEIIVWIAQGHLSGLEYAWVSDQPPARWPRPDEMEVIPQNGP